MYRLTTRFVALLAVSATVGCVPSPAEPVPGGRCEAPPTPEPPPPALANGVAFLVKQQSPDGAWRSDVYAAFRDGTALTPLVVTALQDASEPRYASSPEARQARRRGSEYLAKRVKPDRTIDEGDGGLEYPVYTAALAVKALSHPDNQDLLPARDAWVKYLLARQLAEPLGWSPADKPFGGWGYCRVLPRKPEPGAIIVPPLVESNLSATAFALDSLRAAGVADAAVYEKAAVFVRRCQNYADPVTLSPRPPHLDGGFHFIYDDPVRNKAGAMPVPRPGSPPAFHSYGSTTADGLRALVACGLREDEPRRTAAREWLVRHFKADTHPGAYVAAHEPNREAVYFYYAASVGRACRDANVTLSAGRDWAAELSGALAKRQRKDGSWANPVEMVRENDPLVATAQAVGALAACR